MTYGTTPKGSDNIPLGCVYVPGVGFIPLQGAVQVNTDSMSNQSVPLFSNIDNIALVPSAAYTTTQTTTDQTNYNARGIIVVLDMTVPGTGSVTLEIDGKDPVSGKYYAILTGVAVTTLSTNIYRVYPGLTAVANATASDVLPRTWRVKVTANNANSCTYSVGAMLEL